MLCYTVPRSSPYQNVMLGFVISLGVGREVGSECWQTFLAQHHFAAILISVSVYSKHKTSSFLAIFWSLFHETGLYLTHELCFTQILRIGHLDYIVETCTVQGYGVNETWWIPKMARYLIHFSTLPCPTVTVVTKFDGRLRSTNLKGGFKILSE